MSEEPKVQDPGSEPAVILELRAENFKRLKAVRIRPATGEPLVVVGGQNGQGKSCVLDAIWAVLGGKRALPEQPIRHGQKRAELELDLGRIVARRTITAGGGELTVRPKEGGAPFSRPQEILDAMTGLISFDPLEFARADEARRIAMLQEVMGIDLGAYAERRRALYEERRQLNREAERLLGAARVLERDIPEGTPEEPLDAAALLAQLEGIEEDNRAIAAEAVRYRQDDRLLDEATQRVIRLEADLRDARQRLAELEQDASARRALPEPEPTEELRRQIRDLTATNASVARRKDVEAKRQEGRQAQARADALTDAITKLDAERAGRIAEAHLPVVGLDCDGEAVTFAGVPFSQASSAEQLRVSVALAIAANPRLRVMLIRDGSLLDGANLDTIEQMARESGHQIWIERVGEGPEAMVVMRDGEACDA